MFADKSYTKNIIALSISFLLTIILTNYSYCEDNIVKIMKDKVNIINQRISNSLIPLNNGIAIAIDKNHAIAPASAVEEIKNFSLIGLDSKLNLAILKLNRDLYPLSFVPPSKEDELFFLLTISEKPVTSLVKGYSEGNKIKIEGKYPDGSLLLSFNLSPIGIVIKSESISEVLLIHPLYSEINKMMNKKPGWLGLQAQTITQELSKILYVSEGIVITNIYDGGPSDKAGLKRGDVITEVDGLKIKEIKELQNIISTKFAGETITLKIYREDSQKILSVTLEEPPTKIAQIATSPLSGIKGLNVTEIPESLKRNIPKSLKGVLVSKVEEDSPALGILRDGDIIIEVNKKAIENLREFNEIISKSIDKDLLILVYRKDNFQYVIIPGQKVR